MVDAASYDTDIAIIGAGFGGLGAAIRLQQKGFRDFLIFDRAGDVGGTWRDNSYPGCACDVPSHLYSFSFARNPSWTDTFSGQAEIWQYLRDCVTRYGLAPRLRLDHTVHQAAWDGGARRWQLTTSQGQYRARVLISATGPLSAPSIPDIAGLDDFDGAVFHSARWRHDVDLTGRHVAVVGTGASAAQLVPEIQPHVGQLTLFQRTPAWVLPRRTRRITPAEQAIYRHVPGAQRLARAALYWGREAWAVGFLHPPINRFGQRVALRHLHRQVPAGELRAKLTPTYVMGCKRVLLSNDYWRTLTRDNVAVVTEKIQRVEPAGIVTTDGMAYPVDTIIFATGFHATDPPIMHVVHGRDGRPLSQAWTPTMRAHLGSTVHGFPNLFLLLGPNTGLGHSSVVLMIEAQLTQVLKALQHMRDTGAVTIEPTIAAQRRHTANVDRAMAGTVWTNGGCASWYLDATGRNSTLWPGYVTGFRLRLARFRASDYLTAGG
jgi:cation diffusion facilitator CzcD-associated flavoprotein CzcO